MNGENLQNNGVPIGTPEGGGIPPAGVPGGGGVPPIDPQSQVPMATPEQRQELLDMIESIRGKLKEFEGVRVASEMQSEVTRQEILKRVFEILELSGVDLTDQESVAEYLQKLKTNNPELAAWFEQSISVLLGEEEVVAEPGPAEAAPGGALGIPPQLSRDIYENPNPNQETPEGL